ncbi:MAG: hypothetical protein RMK16_00520 [Acidobacteriota bacterium]|nr:hypothetical protein [Acidobacteriota bacterium]
MRRMGREPGDIWQEGRDLCYRALRVDPEDAYTYAHLAQLHWRQALYQYERGQDPLANLQEARSAAETAVPLRPDQVIGYEVLGDVYEVLGTYLNLWGLDPRPAFEKAPQNYQKALQLSPSAAYHNMVGMMYGNLLDYELERGRRPLDLLRQAVEAFQKALRIDAILALAAAWLARAEWDLRRGQPPTTALSETRTVLRAGLKHRVHDFRIHQAWGRVALLEGRWQARTGRVPDAAWDEALQHFRAALAQNPNDADTYRFIAETYRHIAEYPAAPGRDPTEARRQGTAAVEKALALCPDPPTARTL